MTNRKLVLVTGATGFIGSNLTRRLVDLKYDVHIIARRNSNFWRIQDQLKKIKVHYIDLLDTKELTSFSKNLKPNGIFHLANLGVYGSKEGTIDEYTKINFIATSNLLEASKDVNYKFFINSGSSSEYGNKNRPMKEDDICEPESIYGITKLASALFAKTFAHRNHKPVVTLRIFSPYGPFDHAERLISSSIVKLLKNEQVALGSKTTVRDYIYIDDLIDCYLACTNSISKVRGEIINVGSGKQKSTEEVIKVILEEGEFQTKIKWTGKSSRKHESVKWEANINSAKEKLNWQPKVSFQNGISNTISWFKENLRYY